MKRIIAVCIALCISLAVTQDLPGVTICARQQAITDFKNGFLPYVISQVTNLKLPSQSVGGIDFTSIEIEAFKIPVSQAAVTLGSGSISLVAQGIFVDIYANAKKGTFLGTISDSLTVDTVQSVLEMTLDVGYSNGLQFSIPKCVVEVNNLSFDVSGFLGGLADWILDEFSSDLENNIDSASTTTLEQATLAGLAQVTQSSTTQFTIPGEPITISYSPNAAPVINSQYMSFGLDGTIFPNTQYQRPPFPSNVTLPPVDENDPNDIQIFLSEYVLDSALWALTQEDILEITITDGDIPSGAPFQLTTTSLALLFPGLVSAYGANNPVKLVCGVDPDSIPDGTILPNNISVVAFGSCEMYANNGSWAYVLTFNSSVYFALNAQILNETNIQLTIQGAKLLDIAVFNSNLPPLNNAFLLLKFNLLLGVAVPVLNNALETHYLPLPQIPQATFQNPQIYIQDGYLEVTVTPIFNGFSDMPDYDEIVKRWDLHLDEALIV